MENSSFKVQTAGAGEARRKCPARGVGVVLPVPDQLHPAQMTA